MVSDDDPGAIRFDRFQLNSRRRELLLDGVAIVLGRHAFEILELLVEAQGRLVAKDEILRRVWPGTVVEENNLQVQVSALRKALGKDRELIKTVSGRGYRLAADWSAVLEQRPAAAAGAAISGTQPPPRTNLPAPAGELIGRDEALADLADLMAQHRLITLTGAGGIGKTRLAVEVARSRLPDFADGVWLVELGPLADAVLVPGAIAAALGLELAGGAPSPGAVAQALGAKQLLVALDNCEHVIDMAAVMAETLLRADPRLRVIATSREPLRAEGECLYRVLPLDVPVEDAPDPADALRYGAVQLFLARARAAQLPLSPDERSAAEIGAICRRLDGIPLAIELAAARAAALGVDALAARLDDRFNLLTGGRRAALPRQQTLRATIDWSYGLLPAVERRILCRLAVFAGGFTLEAASAVAGSANLVPAQVVDALANLVAKSLVSIDADGADRRYRLLETMRVYALQKLDESGELGRVSRRHAAFHRDLFEQAESHWGTLAMAEWLAACRRPLDDVRAALDWAFSPGGDATIGVALSATAVPLMYELSLLEECGRRARRALAAIGTDAPPDPRREMQLRAALAATEFYRLGPRAETNAIWCKVLELATSLGDAEYQARVLWGLWNAHIHAGAPRAALAHAERFAELAGREDDIARQVLGRRILGVALHYAGDQGAARTHLEHHLARYDRGVHRWHTVGFRVDHGIVGQATQARILWLQGFPAEALALNARTVIEAERYGHAMSLCYVLVEAAVPIALMVGDLAAAARFLSILLDQAARNGFAIWQAWGDCAQAALTIAGGDAGGGVLRLRGAIEALRETGYVAQLTMFLGILAQGLGKLREPAAAAGAVGDALALCERNGEGWCVSELLRIRGELAASQGAVAAAEADFLAAFDGARRQGALAWQLRAAASLARLRRSQGRATEARELLAATYERFTEGFETDDLEAARTLLGELGSPAS